MERTDVDEDRRHQPNYILENFPFSKRGQSYVLRKSLPYSLAQNQNEKLLRFIPDITLSCFCFLCHAAVVFTMCSFILAIRISYTIGRHSTCVIKFSHNPFGAPPMGVFLKKDYLKHCETHFRRLRGGETF